MKKHSDNLILIKGSGDLATGVAARLYHCGFAVVMTELPAPLMVRRAVSFGEAVYESQIQVEDIQACRVDDPEAALNAIDHHVIPVLVDPDANCRYDLSPAVLVDAIMAKHNTGTRISDAPCVIALGPGFTAGVDCHVVIETNRGHHLGRLIYHGSAQPDTGAPGEIGGKTNDRILRSPVSGVVESRAKIGDQVREGQLVALVDGQPVYASIPGILRGMIHDGVRVPARTKIGDVDPRCEPDHCMSISEKAFAIAGGVLEAILRAGILLAVNKSKQAN
ncbi:MAG: hypothetical protein BWX85_00060 [Chloroflexi bacterium ADurb.Bin120]|jgi:xanthine dehydrogenase accessory factor|nr:MAG: hypothetical protein BWX85_00060 [Chloroflexi bacterium ADurb.Bin120]HQP24271.1 selenium-dependent molybdenum cofactor biosynthesis protein YqeB [Smithellaceae bacterium]